MKGWNKAWKMVVAAAICFTAVLNGVQISARAADSENLALGKTATVSNEDSAMPASHLTDGNDSTRWSSEMKPVQWAYVDLGERKTMNKFDMLWESTTVYASAYNIYVSDDKDDWGTPILQVTNNTVSHSVDELDTPVSGRYVKLEVITQHGYPSVSCYEFKIFYDPMFSSSINLALGKTATVSNEDSAMPASHLTDGNDSTRWSSEMKPVQWAYVDLGERKTMNKFDMLWESTTVYASAYNIYVSDDKDDWGTPILQVTNNTVSHSVDELDTPVSGRYVKLEVITQQGYPSVSCYEFKIFYDLTLTSHINLALNKQVSASTAYIQDDLAKLTDGNETHDSRWRTEKEAPQWAYVDLGKSMMMNKFEIVWENANHYASHFNIYVSDDTTNWTKVAAVTDNTSERSTIYLDETTAARYVKLEVTQMYASDQYKNVSCTEFKIFNEVTNVQDPNRNIALNATAIADSQEAGTLNAGKAVDGSMSTRWASGASGSAISGPHWIYLDFGSEKQVKTIKLAWENRKALGYRIEKADADPTDNSSWTTVAERERPQRINETILLDDTITTRYLRVYIPQLTYEDPDGGIDWGTVSIYEIEAYGGILPLTLEDAMYQIKVAEPAKGDTRLSYTLPDVDAYGYHIAYNGTDLEQVIDADGNIYQPIVDKTVKVSFKGTDEEGNYKFHEVDVTVPGKYSPSESNQSAPEVLPELQEWKGNTGSFSASAQSRIVIKDEALRAVAEEMALDYEDLFGTRLAIAVGNETSVQAGDFYFALSNDASKGYRDEGYYMNIDSAVKTESETATGAYWATRTILQSLKASGNIPCGEARDYPLYRVRGYILDVGRKTFTLDYLEQTVKQMSWYKMNDFHIHLNDNLIPLENLSDPMSAYSAFRLESDVKKGGNNGLNQADLTSSDVWYTKDEFRSFIQKSRTYGVNIVPEFDAPAHSLAFTKVRPDLRNGTSGRQNDHLALTSKYEECLSFIQSVFDEYMTGSDPVFDENTIVHVGADEFSADQNAYVKFADDMLKYIQDSGRTVRIWGSLTTAGEKGADIHSVRSEGVQMNLWNYGWANIDQMYELGFDLINCNDGSYYIVPNAGYYYDRLNDSTLYNQAINSVGGKSIPAGDKQMIGGAFAVWNDMTDYLENGISEYDVFKRVENAFPLFGAKLWGKGSKTLNEANALRTVLGDAPRTDFGYEVEHDEDAIANYPLDSLKDVSSNGNDLTAGKNAQITSVDGKNALELKGGESYINTEFTTIGLGNDLRVKVKRTSESTEDQILFESDYGTIKAVQGDSGKVGFSRENRDYSFAYTLPLNEWVELEFKNEINVTKLYVNGTFVDAIGDGESVEGRPLLATSMFPLARVGSKTNAFIGYVDDIRVGSDDTFHSTMELDHAVISANQILLEHENDALKALIEEAKDVFTKYAPTSEEISSLSEQINELLKQIDYETADYSRVTQYLKLVPEDLTLYTDASAENLNRVIAAIQYDLPLSMQDTVDGYEASLALALQELVLKETHNPLHVDHNDLTVSASSYQDNNSQPNKVIDHDPTTVWHTAWNLNSADDLPHWISFEINQETDLSGLIYTPRSGAGNGTITEYRIAISQDGTNWSDVTSGTWERNESVKTVNFANPIATKYIRLYAEQGVGNFASAAEIRLVKANVETDFDGLNALIAKAEAMMADDQYSADSLAALEASLNEAKTVAADPNADANQIDNAKRDLTETISHMTLKEKPNAVNKQSLAAAIQRGEAIGEEDLANVVSESAVNEFKAALAEAKQIYSDTKATQEEVDASVERLSSALHQLTLNTKGDKTKLQTLVNDVSDKQENQYTQRSWDSFAAALASANDVLANANALQEEIDHAYDALMKAVEGLVRVSEPGGEDPKPEDPSNPTQPDQPDNPDIDYIYSITNKDTEVSVIGKFPTNTSLVVEIQENKEISEIMAMIKDVAFKEKYNLEKVYDIYMLRDGMIYRPDGTFQIRIKLDEELSGKDVKVVYISDNGEITEIKSTISEGYLYFSTNHNSYYALVTEKAGAHPIVNTGAQPIANGLLPIFFIGMFLLFCKKMEKAVK